jgi:SP family xylose:H+ symportor-like MFS transporter
MMKMLYINCLSAGKTYFIVSSTFPPLYDFSPLLSYSLYGAICVLAAIFVWKLVPETKGKTLEDMSILWKK